MLVSNRYVLGFYIKINFLLRTKWINAKVFNECHTSVYIGATKTEAFYLRAMNVKILY